MRGIQSRRIAACVKHFVCNNQETNRQRVSVEVSGRALREIYLPAFEGAVKEAQVWSGNGKLQQGQWNLLLRKQELLVERLRDEWGFKGFVVSEWYAASKTSSTESCINGGLNLEMPGKGRRYNVKALRKAYEAGKFTEETLDRNLMGLLRAMFLVCLFDEDSALQRVSRNTPEHQALARRIAEEGIVLLKNDQEILPLDIEKLKSIAVIGPNANRKTSFGGGSSIVRSPYEITPLRGLVERCGKAKIVKDPAEADVAIIFAGLSHSLFKGIDYEGKDKRSLELPSNQIDLIKETAKINPMTVVILINGSPVTMVGWIEKVHAIVEAWYAGLEAGRAIANLLFGDLNPSGKLPLTFPRELPDSPAHASERTFPGDEKVYYDEGIYVGYRHFDARGIEPLFPFGHGSSYTKFTYENLVVDEKISGDDVAKVCVDVTNVGKRAGAEVVQLYVQDVEASVERPPKELKGFEKVYLEPAQKVKVTFTLGKIDLSFWDERVARWTAEKGIFKIHVGSSSRDIRLEGELEYLG